MMIPTMLTLTDLLRVVLWGLTFAATAALVSVAALQRRVTATLASFATQTPMPTPISIAWLRLQQAPEAVRQSLLLPLHHRLRARFALPRLVLVTVRSLRGCQHQLGPVWAAESQQLTA